MPGIPNPHFVSTSYSSSGTRYRVLPGEETITITASPSASASGFFVYTSVVYSCTLSPVLVWLSGVVGPAFHPRVIIGKNKLGVYIGTVQIMNDPQSGE
jgi:hypothetical protein